MLRMRVQHERDRGVAFLRMQVAAFDASLGTVDDDLGHRILMTDRGAVAGNSASRADFSIPMKHRLPRDQVKCCRLGGSTEERRVGKEGVGTVRTRWLREQLKIKQNRKVRKFNI